jgi:hypothetical protein
MITGPAVAFSSVAKRVLTLVLGLLLGFPAAEAAVFPGSANPASTPSALKTPSTRHKVRVTDRALGAKIAARGGRLIADYGAYQLYDTGPLDADLATNRAAEVRDDYNRILLNAAQIDTTAAAVTPQTAGVSAFAGKRLHLVQFAGPVLPQWRAELEKAGARIVSYIPHNTYLVYGDAAALGGVQALAANQPHVQWAGRFEDSYKVHPAARTTDAAGRPRNIGTDTFAIQLVADADANPATLRLLEHLKLEAVKIRPGPSNFLNLIVRLNARDLARVAAQPEVVSILPYFTRGKLCERQDQIVAGNLTGDQPSGPGYLAWLESKGFTQAQFDASGFAVDLADSGIDDGTTSPNHFGLYSGGALTNTSRVIYNRLEGTPNGGTTLEGCDGHGTLNAHIVGGYDDFAGFPFADASGYHYGLGVCPFVRLGSSVVFDPDFFTSPNFAELESDAYAGGARVSNNSWGSTSPAPYDMDCQEYDALVRDAEPDGTTNATPGNQEMVIVFAAGNLGPAAQTISSPGGAKNVITVGAADSVQPFGGPDGGGVGDDQASSANEIVDFSSRGPCTDGRHKPDLVAPGTHISGGVIQAANPGPDGTVDPCFTGDHISGGPVSSSYFPFFPDAQQFYSASSGTSHSTPCVAGGCALVRQYFLNNFTNPPSAAMTKAYLMNSARYLTGATADDTLWSDTQGMGEMDLGMAFDGTPRVLRDEQPGDLFTASGQQRCLTGVISDTNQPFRVTVAWTDAPGSTAGNAFNNDIDLTVTVGGVTYKGNVFSGASSVPGGTADAADNVESVFLPAGTSGSFMVMVTAANINSQAVPGDTNLVNQDFALVAYNAVAQPAPAIVPAGTALTAETCLPTNGVIDPGETVTVNFALQNTGSLDTSNLVATLLGTGGVTTPTGAQAFGVVSAGGPAVSQPFTFVANATCGQAITATFQLRDGPADLGQVSFTLPVGQFISETTFSENFDEVTAPDLPTNWTSTADNGQSEWDTTTNASDTPTNAVFVPDPDFPSSSELVSPMIPIVSASAQLSFMNNYDVEADPNQPAVAYDGGVLEISINGGPFEDILDAGGSFVTNGYDRTIDPSDDNPLDGRQVWSGNSGGFIQTIVNLPAAAAGQNIQLKWRLGTDDGNFYGGFGWYIDSISITDGFYSCCSPSGAPVIVSPPADQAVLAGRGATFQVLASGSPSLTFQWALNGTNIPCATNYFLTLTNLQPEDAGQYSVTVTNAENGTNATANLNVSVPDIASITTDSTNINVSVESIPGVNYTLEYKNLLSDPAWTPILPPVPGTGSPILLQDPVTTQPSRYYRVRCD